ncbi:Serine/threonine-protein kinase BCK1/SLK1/SSP31 [Nakaseomyces bracarensis]|uniref:Serine/threonine-protein kinase BCK1/SLK1/SSP31 n=1 Tax=Nakaseomyces bracarensis TaxID=273131 RepID=A0ABR4NUU9_9SACH
MTFLKKIAGTNGHSKSGSASNIRNSTISQTSPSPSLSSFKTHVRNSSASTDYSGSTYGYGNSSNVNNAGQSTPLSSKNSNKTLTPTTYRSTTTESPHSMNYRGSMYSAETHNSGFSTPTFDISEAPAKPPLLGDGLYTNKSSESRKSSGGSNSINSLSFDKLILSWDPTNPEEWTMQRVLAWFRYHDFPESWMSFFKKYQIYGQKFIKLLAYENFALYEKYLTISKHGSYDKFQSLLKQTMSKNVSHSHTRQKSGNSISAMQIDPIDSIKMRNKNSKSQDDLATSRSTSESVLLGNEIASLTRPPEKSIVKSHKKTKSTGSLYRRSFISLIGSSSSQTSVANINSNKVNPDIKLHIPSRPQSIVESEVGTAKILSASSSPTYSGILRKHQKSSSSESSLLNAIFPSAEDKEKRGNNTITTNSNKRHENVNNLPSNNHKNNDSLNSTYKPSPNQTEDKSSLWGKIKRKSQTISPSTPSYSTGTANISNHQKVNKQAPGKLLEAPRSSIETLTRVNLESESRDVSKGNREKETAFQYGEYVLDKKYYPYKSSKSNNLDEYILVTRDNITFIPIKVSELPNNIDKFKEHLAKRLNILSDNFTIHMTDFGCDIGAALTNQLIDTIRNSLFLNTSKKFYLKDQNIIRTSPMGKFTKQSSQRDILKKKSSLRSINSSIIASTDEISTVTSSSDIASFDDRSSAPGKQYPQTPSYFYDTGNSSNNAEEINYWNVKEHLQEPTSASKSGSKTAPHFNLTIPEKKKISSDDLQKNTFQILRKDEGKEIDFNKRRRSPYTNPELAPKREAPKPPINNSPQKSVLLNQQISNSPRMKTALDKSKRPELVSNTSSPIETTSPSSDKMVSSYTPGSSHVLVPQPYKGAGESTRKNKLDEETIPPLNFQHITKNRVNRSSSSVSNNSIFYSPSPMLKRGNSKRIVSSASAADVFEENTISFNDVPELSDSDDNENSSEDILWGTAADTSGHNNNSSVSRSNSEEEDMIYSINDNDKPIRKMTLRPTAEMVYQNLEKFFPRAHLDKPVVEDISNSKSPLTKTPEKGGFSEPFTQSLSKLNTNSEERNVEYTDENKKTVSKLPKRTRTIRAIAHEAREARKNTVKLKRHNTKMWGTRIVEVTEKNLVEINKSKNSNGEYKEFAWIKGEMIGKGSFGAVYLSFNVTTGEMMAVKQVEVPKYSSQNQMVKDMVDALKSEVATLKDLDHLNIVQYLGSEIRGNMYSLFLEYVAGGSVGSLIRMYGRFDEPLIRHLNIQVLNGLEYLHSKGILHRDMKADNLLLDQDGVCKISDFGISKKSKDIYSNSDMTMRGTVFWMAPEMVDTKQGYSAKVDIWSLGCIVLEMFAGKRPWSNLEVVAAMFKIGKAKSAPPIPEDVYPLISSSGKQFLDCCFKINPEQRPTAGDLLKHPFSEIDSSFDFSKTSLFDFIKSNDKLNSSKLRKNK